MNTIEKQSKLIRKHVIEEIWFASFSNKQIYRFMACEPLCIRRLQQIIQGPYGEGLDRDRIIQNLHEDGTSISDIHAFMHSPQLSMRRIQTITQAAFHKEYA